MNSRAVERCYAEPRLRWAHLLRATEYDGLSPRPLLYARLEHGTGAAHRTLRHYLSTAARAAYSAKAAKAATQVNRLLGTAGKRLDVADLRLERGQAIRRQGLLAAEYRLRRALPWL